MKLTLGGHPAVTRSPRRSRRGARTVALAAALAALAAAGCTSSGSSSTSAAASAPASSSQKVTLTFWSWVPNLDKVVAIWNKAHPDTQVQVQVQAGGDAELTQLLTAAKAGDPPDLAQVEYQALPTLVSNNYLANIASYAANLKSDFPAGNWNQVTLGTSSVYGIPQDAAPMALFYRADLFKKYHLAVPSTWADFAGDAAKLHKEAPADMPTVSPANTGKWVMARLPQWTAGGNVVGNWGGSSTAVMAASKHQQAAAQFAAWLNTDQAATAALASTSGIYPADISAESALGTPSAYFTNQPAFWSLAKQYAAAASEVSWGRT